MIKIQDQSEERIVSTYKSRAKTRTGLKFDKKEFMLQQDTSSRMIRVSRRLGVFLLLFCSIYLLILYRASYLPSKEISLYDHNQNISPLPSKDAPESSEVADAQRISIKELSGFPLNEIQLENSKAPSWKDLLLEEGGQPIRALVFTTWRSGSTFMGDILKSHPSTFYHYEPLLLYGIHQVRDSNPKLALDALRIIKSLLNCRYEGLGDYIRYGQTHQWLFNHNERLWDHCDQGRNEACWDPKVLGKMCSMHPFQTLKTVRLRVNLARSLLDDKGLRHTKILYIVRDPRGTLQSRKHRDWCPGEPDCDQPKNLCSDLVSDYYSSKELLRDYPERFMVFRYEDFSKDPYANSRTVLDFFNFIYHDKVEEFLKTHTGVNKGGVSSTFRDSKSAPYHWIKDLKKEEVLRIQGECAEAMQLWGYAPMEDKDFSLGQNVTSSLFNPVRNYTLTPEKD